MKDGKRQLHIFIFAKVADVSNANGTITHNDI